MFVDAFIERGHELQSEGQQPGSDGWRGVDYTAGIEIFATPENVP